MTVAELIDELEEYNPNSNVYIRMTSPKFGTETHAPDKVILELERQIYGIPIPNVVIEWGY